MGAKVRVSGFVVSVIIHLDIRTGLVNDAAADSEVVFSVKRDTAE